MQSTLLLVISIEALDAAQVDLEVLLLGLGPHDLDLAQPDTSGLDEAQRGQLWALEDQPPHHRVGEIAPREEADRGDLTQRVILQDPG